MTVIRCPTCNRSSDEARFVGEFCEFCVADKMRARVPDRAEIRRCRRCGDIKVKGQFVPLTMASLGQLLTSELHVHGCTVKVRSHAENVAMAEITCEVEGGRVTFDKRIRLKTIHEMCPRDYKISSGYYEALIQIRGNSENCEKMAARIARFIERHGAFVSKMPKVQNGIDVYASDKTLMNQFFTVRKMKPRRSYRLQGVRNGRDLYSNIYVLRVD